MADAKPLPRQFSPGIVEYNEISRSYQPARTLSSETLENWRGVLQPFFEGLEDAGVVDIGCGTGRFSAFLAESFSARVIGVDPALRMLQVAARGERREGVSHVAGRAEALPLRRAVCDLAWLSQVIQHIRDRRACAEELHRVLRPAARVLLRGAFGDRLDGFPTFFHFFPGSRRIAEDFPTLQDVTDDFADAGFTVEKLATVRQKICRSHRELADRTRLRADSTLILLPDAEFERCQAELEAAAARESEPTAVFELIDLLVLKRDVQD